MAASGCAAAWEEMLRRRLRFRRGGAAGVPALAVGVQSDCGLARI